MSTDLQSAANMRSVEVLTSRLRRRSVHDLTDAYVYSFVAQTSCWFACRGFGNGACASSSRDKGQVFEHKSIARHHTKRWTPFGGSPTKRWNHLHLAVDIPVYSHIGSPSPFPHLQSTLSGISCGNCYITLGRNIIPPQVKMHPLR